MCTSSRCHSIALLGMDACIPQSQRKRWRMKLQACLSHAQQREMITSAGQVRRCCTGTTKRHMFLEVFCHLIRRARATSCYNYTNPWALSSTAVFFVSGQGGGSEPKTLVYHPKWAARFAHTQSVKIDISSTFYLKTFRISARHGGDRQKNATNSNQEEIAAQRTNSFFLSFNFDTL